MNAELRNLLNTWRTTLDDGTAKVIIDMARELGVASPIVSLDELRAQAAKAQPEVARGHYVLGKMIKSQYDGFVKGRIVLCDPNQVPEGNGYRSGTNAVWDPHSTHEKHFGPEALDVFRMQKYLEETISPPAPIKVELRKFVANQRFSEETLMFRAEIYANGKRIGSVDNDGRGGACRVHYSPDHLALASQVQEWILHLPPEKFTFTDSFDAPAAESYYLGEDGFYAKLAEDMLRAKEQARIDMKLVRDAEAFRARGLLPFKYHFTDARGDTVWLVVGVPNAVQEPKARAQLAKKYKQPNLAAGELMLVNSPYQQAKAREG